MNYTCFRYFFLSLTTFALNKCFSRSSAYGNHDAQNISYITKGKRIPDILPYKHSDTSSYTEIVKCWQNSLALSWWAVTLAVAVLSAGIPDG